MDMSKWKTISALTAGALALSAVVAATGTAQASPARPAADQPGAQH
jgi:hypothetical protein